MRLIVASVVAQALEGMDLALPRLGVQRRGELRKARLLLSRRR
jgi:hypothetical protein